VGAGQPRKFTGKERDTETGLDYFGGRYYSSPVARFTTVDPSMTIEENLLDPQRWNRYAYGRNNPLRYVDPDGRDPKTVAYYQLSVAFGKSLNNIWWLGINAPGHNPTPEYIAEHYMAPSSANERILMDVLDLGITLALAAGPKAFEGGTAAPRGGLGPVLKGQAGVERSIAAAEARGETVLGKEITIDTSAARTRIDLATRTAQGGLKLIECKNGPCADLTANQRAAFPELRTQGGVPRGANAARAGLKPDEPIGPTDVVVERH
jgi:RHS repeat-associated protein